MDRLKTNLRTLAKADVVAFGGVGFAGQTLPETAAYFAVAKELRGGPGTVRPHVNRLLADATPAGKVYAATLLAAADPAAGRAAWQRLARQHSAVRTMTGCIAVQTTLAEYAAGQVNRRG